MVHSELLWDEEVERVEINFRSLPFPSPQCCGDVVDDKSVELADFRLVVFQPASAALHFVDDVDVVGLQQEQHRLLVVDFRHDDVLDPFHRLMGVGEVQLSFANG